MARYYGTNYGGYIQAFMDVSHTQNIANNTTTVYLEGYMTISNSGYISDASTIASAAVAGVGIFYQGPFYSAYGVGTHHIATGSLTFSHNPDGTFPVFNVAHNIWWQYLGIQVGTSINYEVARIPRGPRVRYNNQWRNTVAYVNQGGTWKIAVPYVNQSGTWRIGGG